MLLDRHQVIGLASGLREPFLQKIIEGLQSLQPPVLARTYFAEIAPEIDKVGIALPIDRLLPLKDLVDPVEDKTCAFSDPASAPVASP